MGTCGLCRPLPGLCVCTLVVCSLQRPSVCTRYEGTLGAVDTAASTVKLHQVRSFGTEDRKADSVIPASSQVCTFASIVLVGSGRSHKVVHILP